MRQRLLFMLDERFIIKFNKATCARHARTLRGCNFCTRPHAHKNASLNLDTEYSIIIIIAYSAQFWGSKHKWQWHGGGDGSALQICNNSLTLCSTFRAARLGFFVCVRVCVMLAGCRRRRCVCVCVGTSINKFSLCESALWNVEYIYIFECACARPERTGPGNLNKYANRTDDVYVGKRIPHVHLHTHSPGCCGNAHASRARTRLPHPPIVPARKFQPKLYYVYICCTRSEGWLKLWWAL